MAFEPNPTSMNDTVSAFALLLLYLSFKRLTKSSKYCVDFLDQLGTWNSSRPWLHVILAVPSIVWGLFGTSAIFIHIIFPQEMHLPPHFNDVDRTRWLIAPRVGYSSYSTVPVMRSCFAAGLRGPHVFDARRLESLRSDSSPVSAGSLYNSALCSRDAVSSRPRASDIDRASCTVSSTSIHNFRCVCIDRIFMLSLNAMSQQRPFLKYRSLIRLSLRHPCG
jgi:hypothetical protein